jgi:hypothetical protein
MMKDRLAYFLSDKTLASFEINECILQIAFHMKFDAHKLPSKNGFHRG